MPSKDGAESAEERVVYSFFAVAKRDEALVYEPASENVTGFASERRRAKQRRGFIKSTAAR